jgi:tRNA 5-methylaminomethyl-2-thiouridine biosynthesis bifunctional protein
MGYNSAADQNGPHKPLLLLNMNIESQKTTALEQADLLWQDDGSPYSRRYNDVYFSRDGGLAETHHVFLEGNQLQQRWRDLDASGLRGIFTVCELGFGTGLNFLSCLRLWQQTACQQLRLHFISCEKHPLSADALRKALAQWPELSGLSEMLLLNYPDHSPGYHRIPLLISHDQQSFNTVLLDLYFGDALELLAQQSSAQARIDAWFLDGFSPAHNPSLWSEVILNTIAGLSRTGTTLSSYSVTGRVVRHLKSLGFVVEKRKGFGPKRHMLFAHMQQPSVTASQALSIARTAVVIGAGLAGATVARSLAQRGLQVTVLEQAPEIASGASGNKQAIVQMRLNKQADAHWQFHVHSYLYALRFYAHLDAEASSAANWHHCGVLTLNSAYINTREAADSEVLGLTYAHYPNQLLQAINAQQASKLTGLPLQEDGLWQPGGGWINPKRCTTQCLTHPLITVRTSTMVNRLEFIDGTWSVVGRTLTDQCLASSDGEAHDAELIRADVVVIANSYAARAFEQTAEVPVSPLRGQVSHLIENSTSAGLRQVICSQRYIAPSNFEGLHCVGASYVKNSVDTTETAHEHEENLEKLGEITAMLCFADQHPKVGRAAIRGASRDYMPIAGCVPATALPDDCYGGALHSPSHDSAQAVIRLLPGLYLNTGHGSHGSVSCPVIAEHLAALICGEASPLPKTLVALIEPARFVRRQRRRQNPQR